MLRSLLTLPLLLLSFTTQADTFETNITTDSGTLPLCNQTSVSAWAFVDVADAALYSTDCAALPVLADSIQISFIYHRAFKASDFTEASETLLKRNLTTVEYDEIKADLAKFNQPYRAVGEGDRYDVRRTESGLYLYRNGHLLSQSEAPALAKHYFAIWFGEDPFHKGMKKALLKNDE